MKLNKKIGHILLGCASLALLSACDDKSSKQDDQAVVAEENGKKDEHSYTPDLVVNDSESEDPTAASESERLSDSQAWAETNATITVEKLESGEYGYSIEYPTPESSLLDDNGEKVLGPITQHGVVDREPISNQTVRIKYLKEEPVIFELVDQIQFKD